MEHKIRDFPLLGHNKKPTKEAKPVEATKKMNGLQFSRRVKVTLLAKKVLPRIMARPLLAYHL